MRSPTRRRTTLLDGGRRTVTSLGLVLVALGLPGAGAATAEGARGSAAREQVTHPAARPVVEVDLADSPRVRTTELTATGATPAAPWLQPTPGDGLESRNVVTWRGSSLVLPRSVSPEAVLRDGVLGQTRWGNLQVRGFDGRVRTLTRTRPYEMVPGAVVSQGGRRAAWMVDGPARDDVLFTARLRDTKVRRLVPADVGPRPSDASDLTLSPHGFVGSADLVYEVGWLDRDRSTYTTRGFRRTSGRPADWDLAEVAAISSRAGLVAGPPRRSDDGTCVAVYEVDASTPLWTSCVTIDARPFALEVVGFSPDGRHLAGLVQGRGWQDATWVDGTLDTLLVLDARSGDVRHRLDRDFDGWRGGGAMIFEDDGHVLFTNDSVPPAESGYEGPLDGWLVRCSLTGVCEPATEPVSTDTFAWPVMALTPP